MIATEYEVFEETTLLPFLLANVKDKSRNNIKSLLGFNAVFINGKVSTKFNAPLNIGDKVKVSSAPKTAEDVQKLINAQREPLQIIYEDEELIAVNKPCGLLSVATDTEKENTCYRFLTEQLQQNNKSARIFVVHRLDKDTSGVLLFAKDEKLKLLLQDNWESVALIRSYVALVQGKPMNNNGNEGNEGTVHSWLKETTTHLMYSSDPHGTGQEAITDYKVIRQNDEFSLIAIKLRTGRKNQIRVHMKDLGCPVCGDKKYGAIKNPLRRLSLHANLLEIHHPITNKTIRIEAKTPQGFFNACKIAKTTNTTKR